MSTFTNSITNIVNNGYVGNGYSKREVAQISQSIKNSAIDHVNFSNESKSLFQISQIDTLLNGIFGLPNNLTQSQQNQLQSIRKGLDGLNLKNSSQLELIDFDKIYKNLGLQESDKEKVKGLTQELTNYLSQNSINNLFGNTNSNDFSFLSDGYSKIFSEKLTSDEVDSLGFLSTQLNRLLYNSNDNQTSSYLNVFNDLVGLNNPSQNDIFSANSLLTQRNTLLSSTLLNRPSLSNYF